MANLAHVWVMIEMHVIPNGLLKRCFYLSFYIRPLFLIPFQIFLWLMIFKEWPLAVLIFFMNVVYFLALPVYRLSRSVTIFCVSMLGISTNPPEMESETVNLQVVHGCSRNQAKSNTNPTPVFHSFSFSCVASISFQLIIFPVPNLLEDDDEDSEDDDSDDDDRDFEEVSMYLEHDPDKSIGFIEFCSESIQCPYIDAKSSDTSRKGRLYPNLDSIWNLAPSSISNVGPGRLYPSLGSIDPSSGSSTPAQSIIDREVYPNLGSFKHKHPSSVHSSSPLQAIDKGVGDSISTDVLSPGLNYLCSPSCQFSYTSHAKDEVVPYGLHPVDWVEIAPNASSSKSAAFQSELSSSSLFSPEPKSSFESLSSVYESLEVDVNVSCRKAPAEVENLDSISIAITEAQTVFTQYNTVKVTELRNELYSFFAKYEERMRWFDVLNDERTYGISAIQEQLLETTHPVNEIDQANLSQSKDVKKRLLKSLESDLELVYVAQASLTWEALHDQYRKVEAVSNSRNSFFNHNVLQEYQTFQVVLEKFDEETRHEGRRYLKFVQIRHSSKKLLQVPQLSGYVENDRGRTVVDPNEVLKAIERCIEAFHEFMKSDRDRFWRKLKSSVWIGSEPRVEDPRDLLLLAGITKRHKEKELQLKDLQGNKRKLWKKRLPPTAPLKESDRREMLFAVMDLKLVERVIQMSSISSNQLKWCQQKLDNITFVDRQVRRVGTSGILFPVS